MIRTFIGGVAHGQQIDVPEYLDVWHIRIHDPVTTDTAAERELPGFKKAEIKFDKYYQYPFAIDGRRAYLFVHENIEQQHVFGLLINSLINATKALKEINEAANEAFRIALETSMPGGFIPLIERAQLASGQPLISERQG